MDAVIRSEVSTPGVYLYFYFFRLLLTLVVLPLLPSFLVRSSAAPLFHAAPLQFCNPGRRAEARPGFSGVGSLTAVST